VLQPQEPLSDHFRLYVHGRDDIEHSTAHGRLLPELVILPRFRGHGSRLPPVALPARG
jgi:hypothetical protein